MLLCTKAELSKMDKLKELGYAAIDAAFTGTIYFDDPKPHEPILDDDDYEKNLDFYIEKSRELGIEILSSHIPYRYKYLEPDSETFEKCHKMAVRSLKATEYIGAKWAVMHVTTVEGTVNYVKRLFAESGVKNVGIAIENMSNRPVSELIEAVDILVSEGYNVGICLDIGHCHQNKFFDNDISEVIKMMGHRIKVLHVHDNSRGPDVHKAPYMGTVPWERVMPALKEIGFEGALNLELMPNNIPEPAREAYEQYAVAIGKYLISLYDKA